MYIIVRDFLRFCTSSVHICLHELFYYVKNWYYCGWADHHRPESPDLNMIELIPLGLIYFSFS